MSAEVSSTIENCVPDGEELAPGAEELEGYYAMLEAGNIPDLQWQFPGRCAPSESVEGASKVEPSNAIDTTETDRPTAKNDFDFSDDVAQPQMRVRSQHSTPKSTKKKIANFAGVMEVLKKKNAEGSS